ncbi:hypothetical protein KY311_05045, partial [Candidatus Woesearchaeota archaeon]|nr:hypothetical protein [Candidatus Woesearchaeota archaeon]
SFAKGLFKDDECVESWKELRDARTNAFKLAYQSETGFDNIGRLCRQIEICYPDKYISEFVDKKASCRCVEDSYYTSKINDRNYWPIYARIVLIEYVENCVPAENKKSKLLEFDDFVAGSMCRYPIISDAAKLKCDEYLMAIADAKFALAEAEIDPLKQDRLYHDAMLSYSDVVKPYPYDVNAHWGYVKATTRTGSTVSRLNSLSHISAYEKEIGIATADDMRMYVAYLYVDDDIVYVLIASTVEEVADRYIELNTPIQKSGVEATAYLAYGSIKHFPNAENEKKYKDRLFNVLKARVDYPGAEDGLLLVADAYKGVNKKSDAKALYEQMLAIYQQQNMESKADKVCAKLIELEPGYCPSTSICCK